MLNMVSSCSAWYRPLLSWQSLQHRHGRKPGGKTSGDPRSEVCRHVSPVHASQSQVDVWVLEQHSRKEVLLGGMDQERRVYDLPTHTRVYSSAQSGRCGPATGTPAKTHRRGGSGELKGRFCVLNLEQLSVGQRLAQQLLHVAADDEQSGHHAHQHPAEDERETHPAERERGSHVNLP